MVKSVTIDSSVIISSLLPNEKRHEEARQIWEKVPHSFRRRASIYADQQQFKFSSGNSQG